MNRRGLTSVKADRNAGEWKIERKKKCCRHFDSTVIVRKCHQSSSSWIENSNRSWIEWESLKNPIRSQATTSCINALELFDLIWLYFGCTRKRAVGNDTSKVDFDVGWPLTWSFTYPRRCLIIQSLLNQWRPCLPVIINISSARLNAVGCVEYVE